MNTVQSSHKIYNPSLTVSPHYIVKLKQITAFLKSIVKVLDYLTAKMSL